MDSGHCVYDVLDYNTGTWWNCDDDTITQYSECPKKNVYDYLSMENEQKRGGGGIMNGSDRIMSMLYIKKTLLHPAPSLLVPGNQYPKKLNILRRE